MGDTPITTNCALSVAVGTPWLSGWAKRVKLSIDADDIDSGLTWFPVTVKLGTSVGINSEDVSFIFDELTSDANRFKIALTRDDGITQLYVEIEDWDDASETAVLHVSKTGWTISSSADTDMYLYFDSSHADNLGYVYDGREPTEQISTASYDAFGILVKTGADEVIYFYRKGTSHLGDKGDIYKCLYTPSTKSWGTPAEVFSDGTYDCRNVAGGLIGTDIFLFFVKYNHGGSAFVDIGYIKSADGGDSWGSWTSLSGEITESSYSPFGALVPTGTAGKYLQTWYEFTSGTPSWKVKTFVTTNSGTSWTTGGTIYSGTDKWCETCAAYIGDSKLIALLRDNDGNYVGQSMSEDDGDNWGTDVDHDDGVIDSTNLGESGSVKVPSIYYDAGADQCIALYQDRGTKETIKISVTDASTVYGSPSSWTTPTILCLTPGTLASGYPSIVELATSQYFYIFTISLSASDEDTLAGHYSSAWGKVWNSNFKFVSHMGDHPNPSYIKDVTTNNLIGTKHDAAEPAVTASGQIVNAQDFDGSDDEVDLGDAPFLSDTAGTVSMWLKKDVGATDRSAWGASDLSDTTHFFQALIRNEDTSALDNDTVTFLYFTGAYIYQVHTPEESYPNDGAWRRVTWASDGSTIKILINGVNQALTVNTGSNNGDWFGDEAGCDQFNIGVMKHSTSSYSAYFPGLIDEVRVSSVDTGADWEKACYESERDNLLDWGSEEAEASATTRTHGRVRTVAQGITMAISVAPALAWARTIASGVTAVLSISRVIATTRDIASSVTAAVSLARSRNRHYSISLGLTVATIISRVLAIGKTISSGVTAALSVGRSRNRTYSISVGLSAFLTIVNRFKNLIVTSCGLVVSSSVSLVRGFTRTVAASSTVATAISTSRGWTEVMVASLKLLTSIPALYEYYITGDNGSWPAYGAYWYAQSFTPSVSHEITKVKLLLSRYGTPGIVKVSIRATDGSGHPTGADLCSATFDGDTLPEYLSHEWWTITFDSSYQLSQGTKYAIVARATGGTNENTLHWRVNCMLPSYSGGCMEWSTNSGSTWGSEADCDFMFEEWCDPSSISRVASFVRALAPSLKSISSFAIDWSAISDTLITIGTNLSVATSVAYQWAAKRTVAPSLTLTAAISRAVTTSRSVSASITLAVSFLINEAVGRALKVITTVSHVFSMKTVATHVRKIITREGD